MVPIKIYAGIAGTNITEIYKWWILNKKLLSIDVLFFQNYSCRVLPNCVQFAFQI